MILLLKKQNRIMIMYAYNTQWSMFCEKDNFKIKNKLST